MARFRDWVELAQTTVRALEGKHVARLVSLEVPRAQRRLTSTHAAEIDGDGRRVRRWARTASAILYGIVQRLVPQRRVIFVISLLVFGMSVTALALQESWQEPTILIYAGFVLSFLALVFLLGMELLDKIEFRDELELARQLQAQLVPQSLPDVDGWEIAAFNSVASAVGGDLYDFQALEDGRIAILFGDASGHGMSAGLIMAVAHAGFRTQLQIDPDPCAMFRALNRVLCQTGSSRSFFAAAYALIDSAGGFEIVTAGHPPILRLGPGGNVEEEIGEGAYPLGIRARHEWPVSRGVLGIGETFLFHSDGLMESRNERGSEFGTDRIASILRWNAGGTVRTAVSALRDHWSEFMKNTVADDDVSVAALRRLRDASQEHRLAETNQSGFM